MLGPERGADRPPARAAALHGRDRRFDNPAQGAFPAGVRRADHASFALEKQHDAAVGAGDAQGEAGRRRHQRVAARAVLDRKGRINDERIARMNLKRDRQPIRPDVKMFRHASAILIDGRRRVARAHAAVEGSVNALGNAAPAREEGVARGRRR